VEQPKLYLSAIKEFLSDTIQTPNSALKQLGLGIKQSASVHFPALSGQDNITKQSDKQ
jgi:hypothetical protein